MRFSRTVCIMPVMRGIGFISTSDKRVIGFAITVVGIGLLLIAGRKYRDSWPLAALATAVSTWGFLLLWKSGTIVMDAPDGWSSVSMMMSSTFDSWLWVIVFGVVSGLVWLVVLAVISGRRPLLWTSVAVFAGALLAVVSAGLLDSSISR